MVIWNRSLPSPNSGLHTTRETSDKHPSTQVKFMSWNIARDRDFQKMLHQENGGQKLLKRYTNAVADALNNVGKSFRDTLIGEFIKRENPEIIALQEVQDGFSSSSSKNGRITKWLDPKKYDYHKPSDMLSSDAIVAWDKKRFEKIAVEEGVGFTLVYLKDRVTDKVISVASGHFTGVEDVQHPDPLDAQTGNNQLEAMVEKIDHLNKSFKSNISLVGMDANVSPTYQERFQPLIQRKYHSDEQANPTIKHFKRGEARRNIPDKISDEKIDHIYHKGFKTKKTSTDHTELRNPNITPSDHNYITMTLQPKLSLWEKRNIKPLNAAPPKEATKPSLSPQRTLPHQKKLVDQACNKFLDEHPELEDRLKLRKESSGQWIVPVHHHDSPDLTKLGVDNQGVYLDVPRSYRIPGPENQHLTQIFIPRLVNAGGQKDYLDSETTRMRFESIETLLQAVDKFNTFMQRNN